MNRKKTEKLHRFALSTILIFILITLSSCASRGAVNERQLYAYITNSEQFFLLPPSGIEKPMDMAQHISATYGGRNFYFNTWIQADETGMEMTLFNELGASMGELRYSDGFIELSSPVLPNSLKPEYIVADFQLCFYDPIMLREALRKCGLTFEANEKSRRILERGNLIIEIEKNQNIVQIKNHLRRYTYTLEGDF